MLSLPCRILLVDHASRLPLWEAAPLSGLAQLTKLDPKPYSAWDVSALALVFQIGAPRRSVLDLLPILPQLHWCKARISYARNQPALVIVEKRERTPCDMAGMCQEIALLAQAAAPIDEEHLLPSPAPTFAEPSHRLGVCLPKSASHLLPDDVRTLVLVEDTPSVRSVCVRILQTEFVVFETCGSLDALSLADRLPIPLQLLVSDISLPNMDGITLAHLWLRRQPESRVLLLSGRPYDSKTGSPAIAFMPKPFFADDFMRTVQNLTTGVERSPAHV